MSTDIEQVNQALVQFSAVEAKRLADERAEIERQRAALAVPNSSSQRGVEGVPGGVAVAASPGKAVRRPSDEEIIAVVAEHFGVSPAVAAGWLSTIREAA